MPGWKGMRHDRLSAAQRKTLEVLSHGRALTTSNVAVLTNSTPRDAWKRLTRLYEKGMVKKVPHMGKDSYWQKTGLEHNILVGGNRIATYVDDECYAILLARQKVSRRSLSYETRLAIEDGLRLRSRTT